MGILFVLVFVILVIVFAVLVESDSAYSGKSFDQLIAEKNKATEQMYLSDEYDKKKLTEKYFSLIRESIKYEKNNKAEILIIGKILADKYGYVLDYEKEYKRIEESILQAYSKDYRQTNQMYQAIDRANQVLSDVNNKKSNKERSVVKDAVVGGIIAGPAGAVVGAINAADKNRKNSTKTK